MVQGTHHGTATSTTGLLTPTTQSLPGYLFSLSRWRWAAWNSQLERTGKRTSLLISSTLTLQMSLCCAKVAASLIAVICPQGALLTHAPQSIEWGKSGLNSGKKVEKAVPVCLSCSHSHSEASSSSKCCRSDLGRSLGISGENDSIIAAAVEAGKFPVEKRPFEIGTHIRISF